MVEDGATPERPLPLPLPEHDVSVNVHRTLSLILLRFLLFTLFFCCRKQTCKLGAAEKDQMKWEWGRAQLRGGGGAMTEP